MKIQTTKYSFISIKMASMGEMIGNIAHQWRQTFNYQQLLGIRLQNELNMLDKSFR